MFVCFDLVSCRLDESDFCRGAYLLRIDFLADHGALSNCADKRRALGMEKRSFATPFDLRARVHFAVALPLAPTPCNGYGADRLFLDRRMFSSVGNRLLSLGLSVAVPFDSFYKKHQKI